MRKDAEKIVKLLSKETLLRITGHEFDRRLIHPVLIEANKTSMPKWKMKI